MEFKKKLKTRLYLACDLLDQLLGSVEAKLIKSNLSGCLTTLCEVG